MLEEQYIFSLSPFVKNFKKIGATTYQFSCLECEDFKWSPANGRANIFVYKGRWVYHCYRCGTSHSFSDILENHFPELYEDYVFANFGNKRKKKREEVQPSFASEKPTFKTDGILKHLTHLNKALSHDAVKYLVDRGLSDYINLFYYTDNYKKYINEHVIPKKFKNVGKSDSRVILPFFDKYNNIIGMQGRSLDLNCKVRYITTKLIPEEDPFMFGMDRVDETRPIYVLEGPIDSLFIDNAIAWAGGGLHTAHGIVNEVLVWDNEPRAENIIKQMQKAIDKGKKIVIWDKRNREKDVNDMILKGMKINNKYFADRTYSGLEAQLEFDAWRKV